MTTAVRGGLLLEPGHLSRSEDLLLGDGIIEEVGRHVSGGDRDLDASGCIVIAGLVDAHTHSGQVLAPRLWDDVWLEEWMLLASYLGGPVTPEDAYIAAAVTAGEILASGGVALLDHAPRLGSDAAPEAVEAVASAYIDIGIRASLAPLFSDLYLWDRLPEELKPDAQLTSTLPPPVSAKVILAQARDALLAWNGRHERIRCLLGPTGAERCSDELLNGIAGLAAEYATGIHTHLLESPLQRLTSSEKQTERLAAGGLLGPGSSVAHGVWLDDSEIAMLARTRTTVVHCPVSNLRIGSGIAPLRRLRSAGVSVALGGDGGLVDPSFDLFALMQTAAVVHRSAEPPTEWPTAEDVLEFCQRGGARALGLATHGRLVPGGRADLVVLAGEGFSGKPEQAFNELVHGPSRARVQAVVVAGHVVVENGQPTIPGWEELRRRAAAVRERHADDALEAMERAAPLRESLREIRETAQRLVRREPTMTARHEVLDYSGASGGSGE